MDSLTETTFQAMLGRIQSKAWPVGHRLPSERRLSGEFGVSRVPLREALARLRALGLLEHGRGRRNLVRPVGTDSIARLLPLLVTLEGQHTFEQVFELRLALESRSAALAAERRSEADADALQDLVARFRRAQETGLEDAAALDLAFHIRIADASGNPLFGLLMRTLAEIVRHVQIRSCKDDPVRSRRALHSHESIAEAIAARDPDRARAEMEAHLRYSATRRLEPPAPGGPA